MSVACDGVRNSILWVARISDPRGKWLKAVDQSIPPESWRKAKARNEWLRGFGGAELESYGGTCRHWLRLCGLAGLFSHNLPFFWKVCFADSVSFDVEDITEPKLFRNFSKFPLDYVGAVIWNCWRVWRR